MSNQPIIFDIQYTPYRLKKNATEKELAAHAEARAFYDMTGTKNVYRYITTEGKRAERCECSGLSAKSTGVFNGNGMLSEKEAAAMQERVKDGEKNIWHGFISLSEEDSPKIDTPEKCIALVKSTFNAFFRDAKFNPDNIDLMCAAPRQAAPPSHSLRLLGKGAEVQRQRRQDALPQQGQDRQSGDRPNVCALGAVHLRKKGQII